ncbi:hypothetical protein PAAG_03353 [Paracoccidioides lutzii Pb01]|uniref:Signal recognition particle subunit SRP14 n=1 Tax=Paracoccidioides lutzii (strain ATCC MYA-826 / Pb01) TaxID=502779 RepID=C1GWX9_PARBA|nr:hypothetical protein PAAG_03353 [Paracoccidioides lutzii Pb01]EEH41067.2 hypothetical protein PAAG_03353 [Paracoccidioides lutzii Pb01]
MSNSPHVSNDEVSIYNSTPKTINRPANNGPPPPFQFFATLKSLLSKQSTQARGSIFLTQKRMPSASTNTSTNTTSPSPSAVDPSAPATLPLSPILIRATNGKHKSSKAKVSTVVQPGDIEGFFGRYAEVCRAGMVGMKKRDRSARKKGKGKGKGKEKGKEKGNV